MSVAAERSELVRASTLGTTRAAWGTALAALVLALAAWIAFFFDAVLGAVRVWSDSSTFNHCFFILPIVAYLLWERRALFNTVPLRPSLAALWLLPGLGLVWLVARTANVLEAQQFIAIATLEVLLLTLLGWRLYRALLFPLLYLVLLVPTGEMLVAPLQDFTGSFAVKGLELSGIPVFADGIIIQIPTGEFRIAEACAGLRFLIASIAFGLLFAGLFYRLWWKRIVFVLLSTVVPIIANGVRAYGIILVAYLSDNSVAAGVDHIVYGWGFFAVVTLLLIWLGLAFRDPPAGEWTAAMALAPAVEDASRGHIVMATALAIVLMGAAPAVSAYLQTAPAIGPSATLALPTVGGGWQLISRSPDWSPVLPGADRRLAARFGNGRGFVDFHIAYYAWQRKGAEVIAFGNAMADDGEWVRFGSGTTVATVDGRPLRIATTQMAGGRTRRLAWHWYWVGGTFTIGTLETKLAQVRGELIEGRRAAAVIALSSEYQGEPAEAAAVLADFLAHAGPLGEQLARAADAVQ